MNKTKLNSTSRFGVIGYGSWATAIVYLLISNGNKIKWHIRNEEVLDSVNNEGINTRYLRDVELDNTLIEASSDVNEVIKGSDIIILATPSAYLEDYLAPVTEDLSGKYVISAIKGIIPDKYITITEYIHEYFNVSYSQLGLISGPTHAEEVARGALSYVTVSCKDIEDAKMIGSKLESPTMNVRYSTDIYGIEYFATLKNIYAISAGLARGLGYGDNFIAVLVACSAREIKHFINKSYPYEREVSDYPYLGDLLVTCYSPHSRNRQLGHLIGKGCTVKSALNEMTMVAEGYYASNGIHNINKRVEADMPIADMVYNVLYCHANARKAMAQLATKL